MSTLGLDLSSQSLSAIIINELTGEVITDTSLSFARSFPDYQTENGFVRGDHGAVFTYPSLFLEALDQIFVELKAHLSQVKAISISGQQHASVYLKKSFAQSLHDLQTSKSLKQQLEEGFSRDIVPIWMDHSTTKQCEQMNHTIDKDVVTLRSGSPYCERFTAAQIRKFYQEEPEAYQHTDKIHLVSSFIATVLSGKDAPIDHGDGAGMNLMDLCSKDWCDDLLNACAPKLKEKLPELSSCDLKLGPVHSYFSSKYNMPSDCQVVIASGDNPSSLVGCGATGRGTAVISLGTSDTFFSASGYKTTDTEGIGHIFGNPAGGWMGLICFRNGSLTRETVLKRFDLNWEVAERMISHSAPTAIDQSPLPYFEAEISPSITSTTQVEDLNEDASIALTSLIESQIINMKLMSKKHLKSVKLIRLTGGGSKNNAIAQMIADVFQAEVQCISTDKSAALGAAMRAAQAVFELPFKTLSERFVKTERVFAPRTEYEQHYAAKERELNDKISLALHSKPH